MNPLFERRTKQFGIGGALPPKKELHKFIRFFLSSYPSPFLMQELEYPLILIHEKKISSINFVVKVLELALKVRSP